MNEVGEEAAGVEELPSRTSVPKEDPLTSGRGAVVHVGRVGGSSGSSGLVVAPEGPLPVDCVIVWCRDANDAPRAAETAAGALESLG